MDHFEFHRKYVAVDNDGRPEFRIISTFRARTPLGSEILRRCYITAGELIAERTSGDSQDVLHQIVNAEILIIFALKSNAESAAKVLKDQGLWDWIREEDINIPDSLMKIEE
ncbi:hypothetical protein KKC63_02485 [Patescibacteria group bacterium]|nr:hypothetical protein [Patescibacteria group bacterium]MBU4023043.1 hypothetical protein [Patescibacteria group bacterium]MBU4078192.1 hypothetical protein [Patescibacteria group bacterium]